MQPVYFFDSSFPHTLHSKQNESESYTSVNDDKILDHEM